MPRVHGRTAKVEDDHFRIPSAPARKAQVDNERGALPQALAAPP